MVRFDEKSHLEWTLDEFVRALGKFTLTSSLAHNGSPNYTVWKSYLPHQAVCRENSETTKVRVVYDASCKDGKTSTSLNDCLHKGPALTPLIFDILLRLEPIV